MSIEHGNTLAHQEEIKPLEIRAQDATAAWTALVARTLSHLDKHAINFLQTRHLLLQGILLAGTLTQAYAHTSEQEHQVHLPVIAAAEILLAPDEVLDSENYPTVHASPDTPDTKEEKPKVEKKPCPTGYELTAYSFENGTTIAEAAQTLRKHEEDLAVATLFAGGWEQGKKLGDVEIYSSEGETKLCVQEEYPFIYLHTTGDSSTALRINVPGEAGREYYYEQGRVGVIMDEVTYHKHYLASIEQGGNIVGTIVRIPDIIEVETENLSRTQQTFIDVFNFLAQRPCPSSYAICSHPYHVQEWVRQNFSENHITIYE